MRINIVHKIPDAPSSPSREALSALSEGAVVLTTKDELTRLRKEIEGVTDAKKKFELQRKIVRLERFDRLQEGEGIPMNEPIKKILQGKTVDTYLGSDLLSLKKRGIDLLPLVFVANEGTDGKKTSRELTGGEKFTVNFGKNKYLNDDIGAGDVLPRDIVSIKVNGVEGVRKDNPRPGYYAERKYLPIFDGDVVEIMSKGTLSPEEVLQAQTAQDKRWTFLRASDMIDSNNKNPLTDLEEDRALFSEIPKVIKERENLLTFSKTEFAEKMIPLCKKIGGENGIPWQVMFGQAALESGWGKSQLTRDYNNFFGIKAHGWSGRSVSMATREEGSGGSYMENASFRVYNTPEEGLQGYVDFLKQNPRYKNAFQYADNPLAFVQEIKKAGYATDSAYVSKVQSIWESFS